MEDEEDDTPAQALKREESRLMHAKIAVFWIETRIASLRSDVDADQIARKKEAVRLRAIAKLTKEERNVLGLE